MTEAIANFETCLYCGSRNKVGGMSCLSCGGQMTGAKLEIISTEIQPVITADAKDKEMSVGAQIVLCLFYVAPFAGIVAYSIVAQIGK